MGARIVYGQVSESKPGFAKVHFDQEDEQEGEGYVSDWLPVISTHTLNDKFSFPLDINEHVACLMEHDMAAGVIVGAIYSEVDLPDDGAAIGKYRRRFEDGTVIEYDKSTGTLTADVKTSAEIKVNGTKMRITDDGCYIERGTESIHKIMSDLLNAIQAATFTNGAGTTSVANNLATFQQISIRLNNILP